MTGEADLATLLAGLRPRLSDIEFAFGVVSVLAALPPQVVPWGTFQEAEGMTLIAPAADLAETGIEHTAGWALITLEVHSALEAVGMIAAIARVLADNGISTNVVAAFYHDHLFVPWARRHDAMRVLAQFSAGTAGGSLETDAP